MSRCCLALLLGLLLCLASPVVAQSSASPAVLSSPAGDDTDPVVELVWLPLGGPIGWIVLLRWPG